MAQQTEESDGLKMAALIKDDPAIQALHFIRLECTILLSDKQGLSKDRSDAISHIYDIAGKAMLHVLRQQE